VVLPQAVPATAASAITMTCVVRWRNILGPLYAAAPNGALKSA
jgi:ABC-type glycerol-3-phosphate transport system permease component